MTQPGSRMIAYAVDPAAPLRMTACGIRAPQAPFPQARREMSEFIAFLVIKGSIELTDEMPDGHDRVVVPAGRIHVVAPRLWQSSTRPFPPGMVFLWFHFSLGTYQTLDAEATDAVVRELHRPEAEQMPQRRWLIPRDFDFGAELDEVARAHTAMLENERVWGNDDRGTQALGAALIYRLHRDFVRSRLAGRDITRHAPERVHVARAREFIRLHHERAISLAGVAKAIGLNPAYLSRCFRRVTGRTVGDMILDARIDTAKRLLLEGHGVKETARLAGFASSSYFCRLFRRSTLTTPLGYVASSARKERRNRT